MPTNSRYPISSWPVVYGIIVGVLVLDIILLYLLTTAFA